MRWLLKVWLSQLRFYWVTCNLKKWSSLIKSWHVVCVQLQKNQPGSHLSKTLRGKIINMFLIFLHSELCAGYSLMSDRHELQIKHHLILIILFVVELSTGILAVHLKCLKCMIYIISIHWWYCRAWTGKWFISEYSYGTKYCW